MSASSDWARTRELRKERQSPYAAIPRKNAKRANIFIECMGCHRCNIPIDENRSLCPECEEKRKNESTFGSIGEAAYGMIK